LLHGLRQIAAVHFQRTLGKQRVHVGVNDWHGISPEEIGKGASGSRLKITKFKILFFSTQKVGITP
jgi:2-iminoacetate synthase ThiH